MTKTRLNKSDLQFYPSERLTDNPDGGGLALGTPIQGTADELFNPISSIERVNGGFALRKVFAGVLRDDDEPLIGSFVALTKPPKDPSVSYLLTHADSFGQQRADVIKDIEAFVVPTTASFMTLLGNHTKNSKQVTCYQRVGEPLPQVGDVFCLIQDNKGSQRYEQFIKVAKVDIQSREFGKGGDTTFRRSIIKITTTDTLNYDFVGLETPSNDYVSAPTKIYDTQVVDAGRYFGISGTKQEIRQNSQTVTVDNVFAQLIPTNQIATALTDMTANNALSAYVGKKDAQITINQHTAKIYVGNKVTPATLIINTSVGNIVDKIQHGNAISTIGTLYLGDNAMGVIDYSEGTITLNSSIYINHVTFMVAGMVTQYSHSDVIAIEKSTTQTLTYQFKVAPVRGTTAITYQSMGKKYTLTDDGTGRLIGISDKHGSGNINFNTGSMSLTLGVLADVGSMLLISWATPVTTFDDSQKNHIIKRVIDLGGQVGNISADLDGNTYLPNNKGELVYNESVFGRVDKNLLLIDDLSKNFTVSANIGKTIRQEFSAVFIDKDQMVLDFKKPFSKGSLSIDYELRADNKTWGVMTVFDDGQGNLVNSTGKQYGTVDYSLNLAKVKGNQTITTKTPKFDKVEM